MSNIEKSIEASIEKIIQEGKVKNLLSLPPVQFEVVLALILQERLKDWPEQAGPVEVKRNARLMDPEHPSYGDNAEG